MHELIATPTTGARQDPAETRAFRVLALSGSARPERLLELAGCSVPRGRSADLHILGPGDRLPRRGELAFMDTPSDAPYPSVSAVLRAVELCEADALVLAYPARTRDRAHFTDIVERATAAAPVDVVVCVDRHDRPWHRVLVPYLYGPLDTGALGVARRLARRADADVTVLHAVEIGEDDGEQHLRATIGDCALKVVCTVDPVVAAAEEARLGYDVIVLGGREPRRGMGAYFTMRQQRLLLATDASLIIVHAGRQPR